MVLYAVCFGRKNYSRRYGWYRYEFAKTKRGALSAVRRLVRSYGSSGGTIVARYYPDGLEPSEGCAIPPGTWVVRMEWPYEEAATPGYQRVEHWTAREGTAMTRMRWLEPAAPMLGVRWLNLTSRAD